MWDILFYFSFSLVYRPNILYLTMLFALHFLEIDITIEYELHSSIRATKHRFF